ncbi:SpvB/TcaC N-terminal domain-containing protein [Streptomyces sp. NPDC004266]|uniref:SpvB/TcaC N-terminal domain-containing protein n=1 Tax=Streptomyces sp. NPDC004266 TaxID=3364693 RepID=UPI0036C07574
MGVVVAVSSASVSGAAAGGPGPTRAPASVPASASASASTSSPAPAPPSPPTVSLPKGGGAIKGIGEKFAADPVTGAGALTVPVAATPGRSGCGPDPALGYDSGAGNGPFGLGWSLGLPGCRSASRPRRPGGTARSGRAPRSRPAPPRAPRRPGGPGRPPAAPPGARTGRPSSGRAPASTAGCRGRTARPWPGRPGGLRGPL